VQCMHFDPSARFECAQPLTARLSPKDTANTCTLFEARTSWERETTAAGSASSSQAGSGSSPDAPSSSRARKAFDDLFKI
jgi:hypothetical protein